jgi:hypothetical protein
LDAGSGQVQLLEQFGRLLVSVLEIYILRDVPHRSTLTKAFPDAGLAAATAVDGTLYETDVYAASNQGPAHRVVEAPSLASGFSSRRPKTVRKRWGSQAVLVLVGIRLGLENVNPIYHENVKVRTRK